MIFWRQKLMPPAAGEDTFCTATYHKATSKKICVSSEGKPSQVWTEAKQKRRATGKRVEDIEHDREEKVNQHGTYKNNLWARKGKVCNSHVKQAIVHYSKIGAFRLQSDSPFRHPPIVALQMAMASDSDTIHFFAQLAFLTNSVVWWRWWTRIVLATPVPNITSSDV